MSGVGGDVVAPSRGEFLDLSFLGRFPACIGAMPGSDGNSGGPESKLDEPKPLEGESPRFVCI